MEPSLIYLDSLSTSMVDPRVASAIARCAATEWGNPSSTHQLGRRAKGALESYRETVSGAIGASRQEVIFTSSASEANNLALQGFVRRNCRRGRHIIVGAIDHPSVLATAEFLEGVGFDVSRLQVDDQGFVRLDHLASLLSERKDTILVSVGLVNNQVGTIQDMREISALCRKYNIAVHSDMSQALGKIPLNVKDLGVQLASFSGHKIHGPIGTGFLYCSDDVEIDPLILGGPQERGRRAGTESVPLIGGLAEACALISEADMGHMRELQEQLMAHLAMIPGLKINGPTDLSKRSCNNVNFSVAWTSGERIQRILDNAGILVGTQAACSTGSGFSATLLATNTPVEYLTGALRVGLSRFNTRAEIEILLQTLRSILRSDRVASIEAF